MTLFSILLIRVQGYRCESGTDILNEDSLENTLTVPLPKNEIC